MIAARYDEYKMDISRSRSRPSKADVSPDARSHERRSSYGGSSVAASHFQSVRASEETETMAESSDLLLVPERTTSLQRRLMRHHDCLRPCNGSTNILVLIFL